jgi:DNA-binding GntR family transcriptional regulator
VIERAATGDAPDLGLADLIAEQHRLLAAHDFDGFIEADEAFHDRIVRASGNLIALQFWSLLRDRQQRLRYQVFSLLPETFSHAVDDHEALRTALEARDPAAFRTRLSTHVARHNGAL